MKPPPPPRGKEEGTDGRGRTGREIIGATGATRPAAAEQSEQADQTGRGPKLGLMDNEAHLTSLTMMTTILEGFCRSASRNGWMHGNASDAGKLANTLGEQNEISSPSSGEAL